MKNNIKILVAYHKPAPLLPSGIFVPIHGGRALLEKNHQDAEWLLRNTKGDDSGENISKENARYNEMTVLYWAWKNYEELGNPEYIGFMHYRRHFIFREWSKPEKGQWEFRSKYNKDYIDYLQCSEKNIEKCISGKDFVYALAETETTVYEQYEKGPMHLISDLELVLDIVKSQGNSAISQAADKYINGKRNYFANMFIMKKSLFMKYCEWIFPILSEFDARRDDDYLSYEEIRFFVSERLTGIFLQYLMDKGERSDPLPITLMDFSEDIDDLLPAFDSNAVPVVFSVDDNYAPMLSVTIQSLIENSCSQKNYDIFILTENINTSNRRILLSQIAGRNNFSMRFINVKNLLNDEIRKQLYIEIHVSLATYFRFFIPRIFKNFSKVIYLDSDLLICHDIAELIELDLHNNWLGAALDIRESIPVKQKMFVSNRNWHDYVSKTLGLRDPYQYFQAGVLIYNIQKFINNNVEEKLFESLKKIKSPILSDQDIMNSVLYGHVEFIKTHWNVEWQIPFEFENYRQLLPRHYFDSYQLALHKPYIIHYASSIKPWNSPLKYLSDLWWNVARRTRYYEHFTENNFMNNDFINRQREAINYYLKKKKFIYKLIYKLSFGKIRRKYKDKYNSLRYI